MSRCFPYPPPGYARNGVSGQALIESIKLQRRQEKGKTEQAKEKKRERKERKKERKEKEKLKSLGISANVKKIVGDVIGNCLPKQREEEAEQVKSDLTEEHEQPISSQNLLYLSDSTQNSNKRKRHASPSTESHNNGKVIRIRFSFKKQKGADASSNEEGVCSTSGRTAYPPAKEIPQSQQQQCLDTNTRTNITSVGLASEPNKILPSCSKMNSVSPLVSAGNISGSSRNKARSVEMLYKSLIEDWLPPPLSNDENDTGELEWLLGTEQRKGSRVKRNETEDALCHVSSTMWPRANFLPNADIHALPYTIPF